MKVEKMKRRQNKYLIIAVSIVILLGTASNSVAEALTDSLPSQWTVKSLYFDPIGNRWQNEVHWTYRLDGHGDVFTVSVDDDAQRLGLSAVMTFNHAFALVQLVRDNQMGNKRYRLQRTFDVEKPAIVEDALVPCNWLNRPAPWNFLAPQEYSTTETVSEKNRFVTRIRVVSEPILAADAVARGMMTADMATALSTERLTMVTVAKLKPGRPAQIIVRQLWAPDHFFWLFEETPSRRSYFMGN